MAFKIFIFLLLAAHRNTADFRVLPLCPVILLNVFAYLPCSFTVHSLGFSVETIMSAINNITSFQICMLFISFSCVFLWLLVQRCRSDGSGQPACVWPEGKAFSISPLNLKLALDFSQMPFITIRKFFYSQFVESLYPE